MLGSIVPSSRFLIKQLLEPINFGRARVIVEYGPGSGVITAELLRRMGGEVTVQSQSGKGTTFTVELPSRVDSDS